MNCPIPRQSGLEIIACPGEPIFPCLAPYANEATGETRFAWTFVCLHHAIEINTWKADNGFYAGFTEVQP